MSYDWSFTTNPFSVDLKTEDIQITMSQAFDLALIIKYDNKIIIVELGVMDLLSIIVVCTIKYPSNWLNSRIAKKKCKFELTINIVRFNISIMKKN